MVARRHSFSTQRFGPTVERLMQEASMTYRDLGHRTGLSAGYIHHLAHGRRPVPTDDVIRRFAEALDVKPDYFVEVRLRAVIDHLETAPREIDRLFARMNAAGSS
jgi:transcriptional regulator with XRE-family HTH domain